jgi:hypothetical protein
MANRAPSTLVDVCVPAQDVASLRQLLDYHDGIRGGAVEGENIVAAAVRVIHELLEKDCKTESTC